jgi:hypothetical protein
MKVLNFQHHTNDPLCWAEKQVTRGIYVHSALLVDEDKNEIIESFFPHVRRRTLEDSELAGIDVFEVVGITPAQEQGVVDYAVKCLTIGEKYSIANLFRFMPVARDLIGEATDVGPQSSVFCSQFVFDAVYRGGGIQLLNAPSFDVAPSYLAWSPLLKKLPGLTSLAEKAKAAMDAALSATGQNS